MNHFFALELSQDARQTIHKAAEEWRPLVMRSNWYDPTDYHITLKFLGNREEAEQPRLVEAAAPIAAATAPFVVRSAPYGGFPDMSAPAVLWAGVKISPELDTLATCLDQAVTSIGYRADHRRYQPHVTVARCRLQTWRDGNWPLPTERLFAEFTATRFVLLQTRSGEGRANRVGLRYNTVQAFPFGNEQGSES